MVVEIMAVLRTMAVVMTMMMMMIYDDGGDGAVDADHDAGDDADDDDDDDDHVPIMMVVAGSFSRSLQKGCLCRFCYNELKRMQIVAGSMFITVRCP